MVTQALQFKGAQFAHRSQGRKLFKVFVLWPRAKARFHTLPASFPSLWPESPLAELPSRKSSSTRSALCNSYSLFRSILFFPTAIFLARCVLQNAIVQ